MINLKIFLKIVQFAAILSIFAAPSQAMFNKGVSRYLKQMREYKAANRSNPAFPAILCGVEDGKFAVLDTNEKNVVLCAFPPQGSYAVGASNGIQTVLAVGADKSDLPLIGRLIEWLKKVSDGNVSIHFAAEDNSTAFEILSYLKIMNVAEDEIESFDKTPLILNAAGEGVCCRIKGGFPNVDKSTSTPLITLKE